jgi:hypothetical protein
LSSFMTEALRWLKIILFLVALEFDQRHKGQDHITSLARQFVFGRLLIPTEFVCKVNAPRRSLNKGTACGRRV